MIYDADKVKVASSKAAIQLSRRIGEHNVIDDPDLLDGVAGDESHCEPHRPNLLIRARSTEHVIATLEEAARFSVPVTPRGGGTGKSGGAIPIYGGIVLDTSRLLDLGEINRTDLFAVVEPGMITGEFQATVESEGLFYPPDPNSLETCCLGGNVAHNAGGPRAFKYGVTREYVMGLEAVLADGKLLDIGRRTIKCSAGYDMTGLFVGSEGTLGVFTRLRLRLIRNPPEIMTLLVIFADEIAAGRAVSRIVEAGLVPRVMEFMDGVLVDIIRRAGAQVVPAGAGALLLVEIDGRDVDTVEVEADRLAEACEDQGALDVLVAKHGGDRSRLWSARRTLSDAVKERARFKIAEDIAVPRSRASTLLEQLRSIGEKREVLIASYGHAGDGNYHVNILWDDPEWDPEPTVKDVFELAIHLKGTITGEHGVGLAKKHYLPLEKNSRQLGIQKALKDLLDPKALLNPGKIFIS